MYLKYYSIIIFKVDFFDYVLHQFVEKNPQLFEFFTYNTE